jgi:hypothetical protein
MVRTSRFTLTGSAFVALACSKEVSGPLTPLAVAHSEGEVQSSMNSYDDVLESIAAKVPGFGGLYFDASGLSSL